MMDTEPGQKDVMGVEATRWWQSAQDRLKYSVEYAQQGIRALFLANGGGIISLLTFAGNTGAIVEPRALFWSFLWFGAGIATALATYIAGYVSQAEIMQDEFDYSRYAVLAMLNKAPDLYERTDHARRGEIAVSIGMACAVSSLALFIAGAFVGLDAVT